MIVPSGVLIPAELAELVGRLAAAQLRREPVIDPGLIRVVEELLSVSLSDAGQSVDSWEPVPDAAERYQVHPRTVRRWAEDGKIPAKKVGARWLIDKAESGRRSA